MVMTVVGPILPVLSARWSLTDMQAGYLFFAQFASSCVGMLMSGVMVQKIGYRLTLMTGLFLMAVGIGLLAHANWPLGIIGVCIFGVAFGTNTPATNLFVAEANLPKSAPALSLVNSSWGIGAMSCPLIVALAQRLHHVTLFLYALAAALIVLVICFAQVRFSADEPAAISEQSPGEGPIAWGHHFLPMVLILFFTYVGTEAAVGGWVASYAKRIDSVSSTFWAVTPAFFYGALLVGRATAPLVLRRLQETTLAALGVTLASIGIGTILLAKTLTLVVVGASFAGLGLASVYPIQVSLLPRWFGEAIQKLGGIIFATGNLGGAVLPWLVGLVSTRVGSLRIGLMVPLLGAVGMLVFYLTHPGSQTKQS